MIYIPLTFWQMWFILVLGVLSNILAKVQYINQNSSDEILWTSILKKFFRKEWASYSMSVIFTGIIAYSLVYIKQFEAPDAKISRFAWLVPIAVIVLYLFGMLNQWLLYRFLGRIQSGKNIDENILKPSDKDKP